MLSLFLLFFLLISQVSTASVANNKEKDIVLKLSTDKNSDSLHHFSGEWLESPWADLYQFRAGDQTWLTAREHCLSLNSDLAVIKSAEQLDWILSHYAPISTRFTQRLVQIGLFAAEGGSHEWKWVDGSELNSTVTAWATGEPYDHSTEGKERCGLLNIEQKRLDDIDCEATSEDHKAVRYICQRTSKAHVLQQKSNNYIWARIEQLFNFFGIGGSASAGSSNNSTDYEDEISSNSTSDSESLLNNSTNVKFTDVSSSDEQTSSEEEEEVVKTLAALPSIEGSGETRELKELSDEGSGSGSGSGSGVEVERQVIEPLDEKKIDRMINKMEQMIKTIDDLVITPAAAQRTTVATLHMPTDPPILAADVNSNNIEDDFDETKNKDMPKADITPAPKDDEEDCEESGSGSGSGSGEEEESSGTQEKSSGEEPETTTTTTKSTHQVIELSKEKEEHVKEFLGVLRLFLDRADHGDLKKLLNETEGRTLLDRMKNSIREANRREFETLEQLEANRKTGKDSELDESTKMSTTEQRAIYKKISSAVIKAAKEDAKKAKGTKTLSIGDEKYQMARENIEKGDEKEGRVEILKSSKEQLKEKVGNDDYYGDYLDDNNVVKVNKKRKSTTSTTTEASTTSTTTTTTTEAPTTSTTTEVTTTTTKKSSIPEAEEEEASTQKSTTSTTTTPKAPTTVKTRKVSKAEIEKQTKLEVSTTTLFPPLPTFPTIKPFTFATLPTPAPPKIPTLDEIFGNLNDQFKTLLAPKKLAFPTPKA